MTDNIHKLSGPIVRDNSGRFSKGSSGRQFGAKNKASRIALERIKSFGDEAINRLWQAITSNERWAIEYVLNKLIPSNSRTIEFEGIEPEDLTEAMRNGDISASEFKELANSIAKLAELTDLKDVISRIDELEKASK